MARWQAASIQALISAVVLLNGAGTAKAQFRIADDEDWCSEAYQRGVLGFSNDGAELAVVDPKGKEQGDETLHAIRIVDAREPQRVIATYAAVIVKGGSDDGSYTNCNTESKPYKDFLTYWTTQKFVTVKADWLEARREGDVLSFPSKRVTIPLARVLSGPEKQLEVCASHTIWGFYVASIPNGDVIAWMELAQFEPNWRSKQKKGSLPKCSYARSDIVPGWVILSVIRPPSP